MSQIPSLISDLAVILISAGLVTLLFKKLKQPVVLGYIVAGILAGPAIKEIPTVTDVESIRIWADIGVVFLLFALGLDFSFKKLMKVGGTAVIGAVTVVIGMMTFGYITGLSLGHDNHIQGFRRYGTTQPTVRRSGVRDIGGGRLICRPVDGFAFHACRQ